MSDDYVGLKVEVVFKENIKEVEPILNAIRQIKGVLSAEPYINNFDIYAAEQRTKAEYSIQLNKAIQDVLFGKNKEDL